MSDSTKLSKTIVKHKISSKTASNQEETIKRATQIVYKRIKLKWPTLHFAWESKLLIIDTMYHNAKAHKDFGKEISNLNSSIKPDGGLIYLIDDRGSRLVLSSEMKKQGTNDSRTKKRLSKQAMGNAVERFHKNPAVIKSIVEDETIFPFIMFVSGCDFYKGSSLRDRLSSPNRNARFNTYHLNKKRTKNGNMESIISIFVRVEPWGMIEVQEILYKMATKAIRHYIKNG